MKWISIEKSKGVEEGDEVFLQIPGPVYTVGKLLKKEKDGEGFKHTFQLATFDGSNKETVEVLYVAKPSSRRSTFAKGEKVIVNKITIGKVTDSGKNKDEEEAEAF